MPTIPLKKCPWKCELTNDAGYVVYSALGSFYIPMLVMLFFYWRIYRAAIRTTRAINQGFRTTKGRLRGLSAPFVFFFLLVSTPSFQEKIVGCLLSLQQKFKILFTKNCYKITYSTQQLSKQAFFSICPFFYFSPQCYC